MTEDEALDALVNVLAEDDGYSNDGMIYGEASKSFIYGSTARAVVAFLRDHPDVARALGIGAEPARAYEACVIGADGQCHRFSHTHRPYEPEPLRIEDTCCGKCIGGTCYVDQVTGA